MIITRYVSKEVCQTLLAIISILMLAFLCQQMVRYLNYAATGRIPTQILFHLVGFEIPNLLGLLLPLSLYLAIVMTYGRLYADHEMSILQMCGFGHARMMGITLMMSTGVSALVLLIMLWLNPMISAQREQLMSSDAATLHLIRTLIPGRFRVSPGGQHVMYVEKLSRDHERANNVFMAREKKMADDGKSFVYNLVVADQGYQVKDAASGDQFFIAEDGYRYEGVPGHNDYKITKFSQYKVRMPTKVAATNPAEVEALPTRALWQRYADPFAAAELQWRISIGIATLLLALLAVPLSAVQPRKGRYLALLPAIMVYIFYINILFITRRWIERGTLSIAVGMWWVHGVALITVLMILYYGWRVSKR